MQKSAFKLNGKPFPLRPTPPIVTKALAFLEDFLDNELLTTAELASRTGYSYDAVSSRLGTIPELQPYRAKVRHPKMCLVWGNRKTIQALSKNKEILA